MGTVQRIARKSAFFLSVFVCLAGFSREAEAATYSPKNWYLTGSFAYSVLTPETLNTFIESRVANGPPVEGMMGFRLEVERGLSSPNISHWIEFSTQFLSVSAQVGTTQVEHRIGYHAVIPVGVTYWFTRSAYIDFGAGIGAGIGLSPSFKLDVTPASGAATSDDLSGKISPVFAGRLTGRMWLGRYMGLNLQLGIRVYSTKLEDAAGASSVSASLVSLSGTAGVTWAFGGVKGTGRAFVEVIPAKKKKKRRKRRGRPKPAPKTAPATAPAAPSE